MSERVINLTQKQYEKIERARKEKEEFLRMLRGSKEYINYAPLVSNTTLKRYPDGTVKIISKTDIPREYKEKADFYSTINGGFYTADGQFVDTKHFEKEHKENNVKVSNLKTAYTNCNRAKTLAFDIAISNEWSYFVTLTFSNEALEGKRTDDNEVRKKFSFWLKNLHKKLPDCKYIFFPEYHPKTGQGLHFHGLLGNVTANDLKLVESGYICCSWAKKGYCKPDYYNKTFSNNVIKGADGLPVYNMNLFKLGFSTVSQIVGSEHAVKYAIKYVTKTAVDNRFFNKKRFWASRNVERPYIHKVQLEVGSAFYHKGLRQKEFILEKNFLDELDIDFEKCSVEYADDDKQYLILKSNIDILNESGIGETIRKTQV